MSTKRSRLKRAPMVDIEPTIEEDNEEVVLYAKIHQPIIWGTLPHGFVIQDLQESQFDEVPEFIKEHYMTEDLLCKNIELLKDLESVADLNNAHASMLRDKCSICAIHEESQELAGVLILRVLHKNDFGKVYSRIKITIGEEYKKIRNAFNYLNRKSDLFEKYDCDKYLRCYLLAVNKNYRRRGVGLQMLRAAVNVAQSLGVTCMMGFFATAHAQKMAMKIGLEVVNEIYYVDWVDKDNGEIIFSDPGPGNYTLSLMAGKILLQ